jgi:hypothetical protein
MTQVEWQELAKTVAAMSEHEKERLLAMITKSLGQKGGATTSARPTVDEFDAELAQVSFDAPPLPADFSRADVYTEHD